MLDQRIHLVFLLVVGEVNHIEVLLGVPTRCLVCALIWTLPDHNHINLPLAWIICPYLSIQHQLLCLSNLIWQWWDIKSICFLLLFPFVRWYFFNFLVKGIKCHDSFPKVINLTFIKILAPVSDQEKLVLSQDFVKFGDYVILVHPCHPRLLVAIIWRFTFTIFWLIIVFLYLYLLWAIVIPPTSIQLLKILFKI